MELLDDNCLVGKTSRRELRDEMRPIQSETLLLLSQKAASRRLKESAI